MSHIVIYQSAEHQPVYHQAESLEEAARHVEWLRNTGQGNDARIYKLNEVPIEVKTYYRVEVAAAEGAKPAASAPAAPAPSPPPGPAVRANSASSVAATPAPEPAPVAAPAPAAAPANAKPEPANAGASANGGRFGLFGKG